MEQNREPRNKPTHLWSTNLQQMRQEYATGKDSLLSKWCWEIVTFPSVWMDLEIIILSEVSQTEKDKYHMISLTCGI